MPREDAAFLENIGKFERAIEDDRPHLHHSPNGSEKDAWQQCSELAKEHDRGMCDAYREQIDTLLVFAGLFSAVVTAFTIESYQWLLEDSSDASALLLAGILETLSGNQTTVTAIPGISSAIPDAIAARINVYWFLSLTISLSSALVAILAKQWIREYARDTGRQYREALSIRQMRFNGLGFWRVDDIVMSIPLLLQVALALFLLGMLELLLSLDRRVATPVVAVISLVCLFYLATTFLPAFGFLCWHFKPGILGIQCPYKSPQAWIIMRAVLACVRSTGINSLYTATSWVSVDRLWTERSDADELSSRPQYGYEALAWIWKTIDHQEMDLWNWHCLWFCVSPRAGCPSQRAASNVLTVLQSALVDPTRVDLSPAVSAECIPQALLLSYSFTKFSAPALHVELLHQIHKHERMRTGKLSQPYILWWASQMLKIHMAQEPTVEIQTCKRLVLMLHHVISDGENLGLAFVRIFTMCFTTARRLDNTVGADQCDDILRVLCHLLLRTLQAGGDSPDDYLRNRLELATYVCTTVWRRLDPQGDMRPPRSPGSESPADIAKNNKVLFPLVLATKEAWLGLNIPHGPELSPKLRAFPDWDAKAAPAFRSLLRNVRGAPLESIINQSGDPFPGVGRMDPAPPRILDKDIPYSPGPTGVGPAEPLDTDFLADRGRRPPAPSPAIGRPGWKLRRGDAVTRTRTPTQSDDSGLFPSVQEDAYSSFLRILESHNGRSPVRGGWTRRAL